MNIEQIKIDDLHAELKVSIIKEDYQQNVENSLKEYKKKISLPGFRPGKVPISYVQKMVGTAIFVEEINKIVEKGLMNYIEENKLGIIGQPLPNEEKSTEIIGFNNPENLELIYEIGFSPKFEIELDESIELNSFNVSVEKDQVNKTIEDLRKRYGNYTKPEFIENGDLVYGNISELNEDGSVKENGISTQSTIFVDYIKDETVKQQFIGKKLEDSLVFNPHNAMQVEAEISSLLNLPKEKVKDYEKTNFKFEIKYISRVEAAELNSEFFNKLYPNDAIESIEQFTSKVEEELKKNYSHELEHLFYNNAFDKLNEKLQLQLPDNFLKRWIIANDKEEKLTPEIIETEYPIYTKIFKNQLIQNKLIEKYEIKVEHEDINQYIEKQVRQQYAHLLNNKENEQELLQNIIQNIKGNKEEIQKIIEHVLNHKLIDLLKTKTKINEKQINSEEFQELIHQH